jgi:DNA (cytosine-5)-methyltransferase 1
MNFISICSGIEAASVAFEPLGWKAIGFSEIEPFPCAVLAHHYPDVPNFGDMTKFREWPESVFANADAIVGGPPCQAFSIAGLRNGLEDARGNLTLVYVELINHADLIRYKHGKPPVITIYENVPGLFSDKTGAFGCFLGSLAGEDGALVPPGGRWTNAGCVFGPQRTIAWRVVDAQFFGVAQRRRRVFVVASARAGFDPAAVLFEFDGVRRDIAPSREAGEEVTPTIRAGSANGSPGHGQRSGDSRDELIVPVASTGSISHYLNAGGSAGAKWPADIAPTLNAHFGEKQGLEDQHINGGAGLFVLHGTQVRRLTVEECEVLQGFPRGYSKIPWRKKPADDCPDGPRYKSLGNSMCTNVMAFIGSRIDAAVNAEKTTKKVSA